LTHKVHQKRSDFKQNVEFRDFFLGIKKRYDMQYRAKKFRTKEKAKIALLKEMADEKPFSSSLLGKRSIGDTD